MILLVARNPKADTKGYEDKVRVLRYSNWNWCQSGRCDIWCGHRPDPIPEDVPVVIPDECQELWCNIPRECMPESPNPQFRGDLKWLESVAQGRPLRFPEEADLNPVREEIEYYAQRPVYLTAGLASIVMAHKFYPDDELVCCGFTSQGFQPAGGRVHAHTHEKLWMKQQAYIRRI